MDLRISPDLTIPGDEAVTRSFGILGMRGSGKSNAAVVLAEQMFHAGLPWVAIDPKGDWWGIRSSADGTGDGLPVVIFGGEHRDVPLEPTAKAGVMVADLILNERLTAILDLSEMSKGQKIQFLAGPGNVEGFAGRLYRMKKREQGGLHVFLEEAHDYVPQQARGDIGKLIDVVSALQTMGRTRGIGCSVVSQRSARVHKDVLTQVDTLLAFRTISPQDRKAIEAWVAGHGIARELVDSLPNLASGESWLWSPEWLGELARVQWNRRETFDSGSTPVGHAAAKRPATLADIDLAAVNAAMAETIERANADDPKTLRATIRDLERQLAARPTETRVETITERVEVPVLGAEAIDRLEALIRDIEGFGGRLHDLAGEMRLDIRRASGAAIDTRPTQKPADAPVATRPSNGLRPAAAPVARSTNGPVRQASTDGVTIGKGERTVMAVLRQWPDGRTYNELAFLAGYSAKASTLGVILSKLRQAGYVAPGNQPVILTPEGIDAAGGIEALPTGPELLAHWLQHPRMGKGERDVLQVLIDSFPDDLSHDELCHRAGYSPIASTMGVILSKLRKLGLVEKSARRLAPEFAEAIAA